MANPTYSTGTVSIAANGTTVTGVGTIWSGVNAKAGDWIAISTFQPVQIKDVTDTTHIELWAPWPNGALSGVVYTIIQDYPARVVGVAAAEDVGDMLAALKTNGFFFFVGPDESEPDPSYGADGQYAFQPSTGKLWVKTGGAWVLSSSQQINQNITLTGTGTGVVPGSIINVTDDMDITATMYDENGNYTPEGWGNVSSLVTNWTSGSAGTFKGARTPLLGNLFFTHPSSPSNGASWYSASIFTANAYTDDNGTAGHPRGHLYGSATVSYLSSNVKHWQSLFGIEADMTVEAGASVDTKVGFLSTSSNNDAVQGTTYDAAFMANAGTPGVCGWRNAFQLANIYGSNPAGSPISSDGTLLSTSGVMTFANAIDVSSATITGYILKTNNLRLAVATANDQSLTGSVPGDAIVEFTGNLLLGHLGGPPLLSILSNGTVSTTTAGPADASGRVATTLYADTLGKGLLGSIAGFAISNNASDPNNDIDIGGGIARDYSTNTHNITLAAGITKRLDAAWAVGTNAGGLDTGTKAANTWYHLYAIKRTDTGVCDIIFSTNASSPTLPTNYTKYRRIRGSVLTDSSGNIKAFVQNDSIFKWSVPVLDLNNATNPGTTAVLRTLSTPKGLKLPAIFHARSATTTNPVATIFTDPAMADTTPDFNLSQQIGNTSMSPFAQLQVVTDTSSRIRTRLSASDAGIALFIVTEGWIDTAAI